MQSGQYERYIQEFQKKLKFVHSHGDWTLSQLQKDDLTDNDSKLYVFTNSKTKEMFFRGKDIPSGSLEILKDVINNYSDFMPSNYYWEVEDSAKTNVKFGTSGFREVFEGISLDQLELSSLPEAIKRSIILQRYYIILELYRNGIDHGHPHIRNFNVRFLLEDAMGRKTVDFDPALAIKTARRYGMTLTPIVILRDWDKAKRISE